LIYEILSATTSNSAPEGVEHARRLVVVEHAHRRLGHLRPGPLTLNFFSIASGNTLVSNPGSATATGDSKEVHDGMPTEDDIEVVTGTTRLAMPPGSAAVVLKNLYVSCDPYMRGHMTKHEDPTYIPDL
jgi:hypothetical protein